MISMTGYGFASFINDEYQIEVELKSVNNRFLELKHFINNSLSSYEQFIDSEVKKVTSRGAVDISIRLRRFKNEVELSLDEETLSKYLDVFSYIKSKSNANLNISDFTQIDGLITLVKNRDNSMFELGLKDALKNALLQFKESKEREGEAIKKDLTILLDSFEEAKNKIDSYIKQSEDYFSSILLKKYNELNLSDNIDEHLYLQEVATLLVKYSINEELNRLTAHIAEARRLFSSSASCGKRLDFLSQEMLREVNTTASKSQMIEISLLTVEMKDHLENIREQIRNIE